MPRKLGSYPRRYGLALAERPTAPARACAAQQGGGAQCIGQGGHRLGEIRDRTFEQQRYQASGLKLVTAAIVLWNTAYLKRAAQAQRDAGSLKGDYLQQYMSPLGWEHINLTGDYVWRQNRKVDEGQFRTLRTRENL